MFKYLVSPFLLIIILHLSAQQSSKPGRRDHLGMAYDEARNVVVLFGGNDVNSEGKYTWNPSTWEWRNSSWTQVDENSPGPISSMSMCYDASGEQIVMMGGINPEKGDLDETWVWDGEEWRQLQSSDPGVRLSAAMAYDYSKGEVVLFSGCVGQNYPTDTWIFKDRKWTKVSDSGPKGVCRAAMFYDQVRQAIVLFGGALSRSGKTNEMWEWKENSWTKIDLDGNKAPNARANMLIAYDEKRRKAVLYGGSGENGILNDLWEWDGYQWYEIDKQSVWPGSLEVYGIVYHKVLEKTLLYGGRTGFAKPVDDFWSWDGARWELVE